MPIWPGLEWVSVSKVNLWSRWLNQKLGQKWDHNFFRVWRDGCITGFSWTTSSPQFLVKCSFKKFQKCAQKIKKTMCYLSICIKFELSRVSDCRIKYIYPNRIQIIRFGLDILSIEKSGFSLDWYFVKNLDSIQFEWVFV